MDTNIIPADARQRDTYTALAASLHRIADSIKALTGDTELGPNPYVTLSILPGGKGETARVAAVDALLQAILGRAGEQRPTADGWTYIGRGTVGPIDVSVHTSVAGPQRDEVQAELLRLRAENERLRRELADDEAEAYPDRAEVAS